MSEELHFISVTREKIVAVMASSISEAKQKVDDDGYNPHHVGAESEIKEYLEDNEVCHL